jgi:hypothetical protein
MPKISALPPMTTADAADEAPIVDTSVSTTKKWTLTLLKTYLQSLTSWITTAMINALAVTYAKIDFADVISNQQAWQTMTPTTGSVTTTLGYYKDSLGIVHLRGQLNMTGTGNFFTLPSGYRPEQYKEFGTSSAGGFGVMSISTAGVCTKVVGSNGNLDLDAITFRAA